MSCLRMYARPCSNLLLGERRSLTTFVEQLSYQYWSYSGGQTSAQWTCNVAPGTQIVFQAIDGNGVRAKSDVVTVQVSPNALASRLFR